jgi:hypothetical protein
VWIKELRKIAGALVAPKPRKPIHWHGKDRERIGLQHYFEPDKPTAATVEEWAAVVGDYRKPHQLNHPDDGTAWQRAMADYRAKLAEYEEGERQVQAMAEVLGREPAPLVFWFM